MPAEPCAPPGVSVWLFAAAVELLVKQSGDKPVPAETLNRWVHALGDIEREYAALPKPEPTKRRKS